MWAVAVVRGLRPDADHERLPRPVHRRLAGLGLGHPRVAIQTRLSDFFSSP